MTKRKMAKKIEPKTRRKITWSASLSGYVKRAAKILFLVSVLVSVHWLWQKSQSLLLVKNVALHSQPGQVDSELLIQTLQGMKLPGLLMLDLDKVRSEVEQLEWVEQARVWISWPDTLNFSIAEKQIVGRVGEWLLSDRGELISIRKPSRVSSDLLTLDWASAPQSTNRQRLAMFERAQQMADLFNQSAYSVANFKIDERNSWQIDLTNGWLVKLGRKDWVNRANRLLQHEHALQNKRAIEVIDLRYSSGFAVKTVSKQNKAA